jgi:hypothetical protein
LGGLVPSYREAEAILEEIGQIHISRCSIWQCVQHWGKEFGAVEARERLQANRVAGLWEEPRPSAVESAPRRGVALDGVLVNLKGEGWKALKVGVVFEVGLRPAQDEQSGECVEVAQAVHTSYVAHLGGPERVGEMLWAEAQRRGWEQAPDSLALGDGAPWIWNLVELHFGTSHQVVDWYHAKQHLAQAARLYKGEGTLACQRWLNSRTTTLYQGQAQRIADELTAACAGNPLGAPVAEALAREAAYFRHHHRRMNYLELREDQWPIGSGMVESGGKQFKSRFCGPGMRWSRQGAQNLIPIRSAVLSNRFDQLWHQVYNAPPS